LFIIEVFIFFEKNESHNIIKKYFEERDSLHLINEKKNYEKKQIKSTFLQLLVSIKYFYENIKVVYLNLKFQNIILDKFHNFELICFLFLKKFNEKMLSTHFVSNCYATFKTFNQIFI
jgi:hypothetical protein